MTPPEKASTKHPPLRIVILPMTEQQKVQLARNLIGEMARIRAADGKAAD